MFFEKVKASKWKLEIDNLELPLERKISSHYEEGEAPVEFASTVEEHYHQIFISAEILHWNSSGNGNTAFKSVTWRRFWSWALAISSLFSSDLDKFKLGTQIKTLKNIVDEKQVGIKEVIKIIYLKRRHIFKIFNIYLKPDRFRKSKFTLSKVKSEKKRFWFYLW